MARAKSKPSPRKLKKSNLKNRKRLELNNAVLKKYTA